MTNEQEQAAADARSWREVWAGIIHLIETGHNPINVSGRTKSRAVLAANEHIIKSEKLACLVLAKNSVSSEIPALIHDEIIGLARELCPNYQKDVSTDGVQPRFVRDDRT